MALFFRVFPSVMLLALRLAFHFTVRKVQRRLPSVIVNLMGVTYHEERCALPIIAENGVNDILW